GGARRRVPERRFGGAAGDDRVGIAWRSRRRMAEPRVPDRRRPGALGEPAPEGRERDPGGRRGDPEDGGPARVAGADDRGPQAPARLSAGDGEAPEGDVRPGLVELDGAEPRPDRRGPPGAGSGAGARGRGRRTALAGAPAARGRREACRVEGGRA